MNDREEEDEKKEEREKEKGLSIKFISKGLKCHQVRHAKIHISTLP